MISSFSARSIASLSALFSLNALAAFYGAPPDAQHPWAIHDDNRPQPEVVTPAPRVGNAPSDATILFDGSEASLQNWVHRRPADKRKTNWEVKDGVLQCNAGSGPIATKEKFGDCQLHIEWASPHAPHKHGQSRGNSGVFFLEQIEVQVLDNFRNPTYPDGSAGSVYGVMPPAVNALRPTGEWQSYDIIFRRPIVREGKVIDEGSMTVLLNGVVIQDSTPLEGGGGHKNRKARNTPYPEKGSLSLQDHGDPVRYRNIWIRPLRPRAEDGGTDGRISEEATTAKRTEIADGIRKDAETLEGLRRTLRRLESLVYARDEATWQAARKDVVAFVHAVEQLPKSALEQQRNSILELDQALRYLQKHDRIPQNLQPATTLTKLIEAQGWRKR